MDKIRTAVIGTGYLGRFHAQKYAAIPASQLVAVVDAQEAARRAVGAELGVPGFADHRELLGKVDAVGTPVFSGQIDIANARLRFANGCVANATASRVSLKTERKLRVFQDDAYLSMDLQQKILTVIRKKPPGAEAGPLPVLIEEQNLDQGDALKAEIESFLDCVRTGQAPVVSGADGLRALETALRVTEQVTANLAART